MVNNSFHLKSVIWPPNCPTFYHSVRCLPHSCQPEGWDYASVLAWQMLLAFLWLWHCHHHHHHHLVCHVAATVCGNLWRVQQIWFKKCDKDVTSYCLLKVHVWSHFSTATSWLKKKLVLRICFSSYDTKYLFTRKSLSLTHTETLKIV